MQIKITGGFLKNIFLRIPNVSRPTTSAAREAIFSSLQSRIHGAHILDAFAGSGVLGIEAISRGAKHAFFLDNSRKAISTINTNIDKCNINGCTKVIKGDTFKRISSIGMCDIVFIDPPFPMYINCITQLITLIEKIFSNHLNKEGAIFLECPKNTTQKNFIELIHINSMKITSRKFASSHYIIIIKT